MRNIKETRINGHIAISGDEMIKLMIDHPDFVDYYESFDTETMIASCTIVLKNNDPHTRTFSKKDAETAGFLDKTVWINYLPGMLQLRARILAFADKSKILNGKITGDDNDNNHLNNLINKLPISSVELTKISRLAFAYLNNKK